MSKDSILFGVIGILLGLIVGFMGANALNQRGGAISGTSATQNSNIPAGHPDIGADGGPTMQQVQDTVNKAKENPNDFDAQVAAAKVYQQIERFPDAANFYRQAQKLKPDDVDTQISLGDMLLQSREFVEAASWYEKVLATRDFPDVRTFYGITFLERQPPDLDRALSEFQKALKTEPGYPFALASTTEAYIRKKDAQKASATLAELEKASPNNEAIADLKAEIAKLGQK